MLRAGRMHACMQATGGTHLYLAAASFLFAPLHLYLADGSSRSCLMMTRSPRRHRPHLDPAQTSDSDKEAMYRAFASRLPHKPGPAVREYCNVVIGSISEELGPDGRWPKTGLLPDDVLGPHRPNDVLERIGFLHLVRRKMMVCVCMRARARACTGGCVWVWVWVCAGGCCLQRAKGAGSPSATPCLNGNPFPSLWQPVPTLLRCTT